MTPAVFLAALSGVTIAASGVVIRIIPETVMGAFALIALIGVAITLAGAAAFL